MTPVVRAAAKRHNEAGSLAEELPYWAWIDERTLLTRRGELVTLAALEPKGIAGEAAADLDHVLASWMRLLGQLESDVRLSLIVTRRPVRADAIADLGHERLPDEIFRSRATQITRRNGELRFYAAWTLNPRLSEAPKKGNLLATWTKRLRSNGAAQRVYLRDSLARGAEQLQRIVDAGRALVSDVCPSFVLEEREATAVLGDLINRPGSIRPSHEGGALHWAWGLSELEAHRKHLTLDGEPLILYSLIEPPPEATANILVGSSQPARRVVLRVGMARAFDGPRPRQDPGRTEALLLIALFDDGPRQRERKAPTRRCSIRPRRPSRRRWGMRWSSCKAKASPGASLPRRCRFTRRTCGSSRNSIPPS